AQPEPAHVVVGERDCHSSILSIRQQIRRAPQQPDQGALESTDCLCSACRLGLYHRLLGPSRDYYSVRAILMGRKTEDERRRSAIPSFVLRPSPIHQKSSDG